MITLKEIKDYFKGNFEWDGSISIGKLNRDNEKSLCFYQSSRRKRKINTAGGKQNKSYYLKAMTITLRYTKNQNTAEEKAIDIYNFLDESNFIFEEKRYFIQMIYNEPISVGTDQSGVYEYVIEFDCYREK